MKTLSLVYALLLATVAVACDSAAPVRTRAHHARAAETSAEPAERSHETRDEAPEAAPKPRPRRAPKFLLM